MMKRFLMILLCLMTIFVISCTFDDVVEIITENIIEEPEQPAVEEPVPIEEENTQEDYIMELKPIKEFSNYIVSPYAVYGIDGIVFEKLQLLDTEDKEHSFNDFFLKDGDVYLSAETMENGDPIPDTDPVQYEQVKVINYFKQTGKDIVASVASNFTTPPASERIEFESGDYKIIVFPYEEDGETTITSRVFQGTLVVGYLKIDGYALTDDGLWYSVAERIKTRRKGVYFWAVGGQPRRLLEDGRIY